MRDIDIFNGLRSFSAIICLFKEPSSPVNCQLWERLARKGWNCWRILESGQNRGVPVNAGAYEVEDNSLRNCWGCGYCRHVAGSDSTVQFKGKQQPTRPKSSSSRDMVGQSCRCSCTSTNAKININSVIIRSLRYIYIHTIKKIRRVILKIL